LSGARNEPPNPFAELTERELEILELIADGRPNGEIAAGLGISEKTVKRHVSNIFSKLHLQDRTQAAVLAWRQGLVRRNP
ncbi:MAG: response regulator transcription factor, partial [Acidobacteriota bacterium]